MLKMSKNPIKRNIKPIWPPITQPLHKGPNAKSVY